ncbi:hypothetical protein PHMEG_00014851 [Phytophthora megakarya]|uniref:Uncharacterized protein n=1 Tax=Phytophthora megakarya TaxID=4795 RepID=A0A225W4U4_9STRA|nr:hypothetical protein PHMEG_00014851 [Phytophthora megakarya]
MDARSWDCDEQLCAQRYFRVLFHAPQDPTLDTLHVSLVHSRTILVHFQKRFAEFAIPTGVTSIDKMIVPTKAHSR